jgi:rhodanese-related sulfurtransferase
MTLALSIIAVIAVVALSLALWIKWTQDRRELERYSITPEDLFALMNARQDVLLYDVRQPLDLLADAEVIPGSRRLSPKDILDNPFLVPRDKDLVVYCTCPSDKTSRLISQRARAMNFVRVKFLKGGISAWKKKGYPVEPYRKSFHLDSAK